MSFDNTTSFFCLWVITLFSIMPYCQCDSMTEGCTFTSQSEQTGPTNTKLWNAVYKKTYSFEEVNGADRYSYNVGICSSADPTIAPTAGALQTKVNGDETKILGQITHADFKEGLDWLMLEYYDGNPYNTHCGHENRSTIIMISCKPGEKNGILSLIEESNKKTENCYYLFELSIDAACADMSSSGLSAGSIVCIVFLSLVAVYLVFGFLYQRFVKGAQGREQFPNYAFWIGLGNLASDGCNLVFRSDDLSEPRQYRGITGDNLPDNQDMERGTSDRDDQMLNM